MAVAKAQPALPGLKTDAERDAEEAEAMAKREARAVLRTRVLSAIRTFARGQSDQLAAELDKDAEVFGTDSGKSGVSGSLLRAAMTGGERNYFRLDWIFFLLDESQEVRDAMLEACGAGRVEKPDKEYARDLEKTMYEELSQRRAEAAIRKARFRK